MGKKGKKVSVEVKVDSWFNLFKNLDPKDVPEKKEEDKPKKDKEGDDDEDDEGDDDMEMDMADAIEIGDQIKDDLVPLALEYYLGVIELEDAEGDDDMDDDDDSEDDKKKPKKAAKKGGKGGAAAGDQKDCK